MKTVRRIRDGKVIEEQVADPTPEQIAARQKRIEFYRAQAAARVEQAALEREAIRYFMAGEPYPAELKTHAAAVQAVLDAKITDQEVPTLPTLPTRPPGKAR